VSSFLKKELIKGPRSYYFSVIHKSELYSWVIYLNFLRVKAIYDSFTIQFGQLNLPLDYESGLISNKVLKNKFNNHDIQSNQIVDGNTVTNHAQSIYLRQYRPDKLNINKDKEVTKVIEKGHKLKFSKLVSRGSVMMNLVDYSVNMID